jgi:phage protein U
MRGDGFYLGWYVIEKFSRGHTHLDDLGIGQQLAFEAIFQRVPTSQEPSRYYASIWDGLR